ncbi:MAG TPA: acetyl-CoA carboxylase biotin carboxyl carrier protein [Planctomycetaceae bacterium]|nr:acetyl-CoA carboxylase biotin carboxyl carrier protein [Planctomycetaceae bacterium]HIQ22925.1 acetyl-CoA carboxylase biotin carboxyl carrier protein [Planctomycetota bacterium]
MAGSGPQQDIFDVRKIRRLVELMKEHELSEIDLRQGDTRIQIRRGAPAAGPENSPVQPPRLPALEKPAEAPESRTAAATPQEEHIALITSPMVGTFYPAPDPDAPPYVKVGDHVHPDTTVCIIEAMKVFNEIQAEVSGKIVAVLVDNGEPVEYGQPLFKVDTRR